MNQENDPNKFTKRDIEKLAQNFERPMPSDLKAKIFQQIREKAISEKNKSQQKPKTRSKNKDRDRGFEM